MSRMRKAKSIGKAKIDNSRKTIRKQKRLQKKQHRQEHYMKKKEIQKNGIQKPQYSPGRFVKRPADDVETDVSVKKKPKQQPQIQDILLRERAKEKKEENKLKHQMEEQRRQMLLKANEEEDKLIKKLEKQLGLKKSKNKNNYFADDGLDYLLEICDRSTTEQIVAAEKHLAEVDADSDFEEDLAAVTGKELQKENKKKPKSVSDESDETGELDERLSEDEELSEEDEELSGEDEELSGEGEELSGEDDELSEEDEELSGEDEDLSGEDEELSGEDKELSEDEDNEEMNDSANSEPEEKPTKSTKSKQNEKPIILAKEKSKEKIIKLEDLNKVFSDDEVSHLSGDEDLDDDFGDKIEKNDKKEKPDVWEDIYGRKRDKDGNIIKEEKGVYIPPHLRNKDSSSDKQLEQLRRQIKSVLNKLSGNNLHWACTTIENLYNNNSRNSVNCTLSQLWCDATISVSATPDRMVAEHAALVSVLHANVGSEIGAHFLQELCKKFDELMQIPKPVEDKTLENVVSCLAHLYSFKIYEAQLLFDVLSRLTSTLSEQSAGCVVCALRAAGAALRRHHAAALKDYIHNTQRTLTQINERAADGSRIKFLLEILMAVKNNNLNKIPNYDPSYQEHLKKLTKSIIRRGNYVTPLNIGLEDLLKADERGKWWVVGSAWEGNTVKQEQPQTNKTVQSYDQKLLELARKQRMNTDVRRSIFCVIMSAEDYMDAFEKLQHLGLKGQQEREIVHVLLACCLQEKKYNPYYAVLAQKLCDFDRKYQLSIQFSVWDKIKDIENLPKLCISNLAQFLVHLIMEKGLPLSVLKVIQFSDLNKPTVRFMRQILLAIIMNQDLESSLQVFQRISKPPKLHMFRESLKLFIQHFLVKNAGKKNNVLSEEDMEILKERSVEVNKILTMHESNLKF